MINDPQGYAERVFGTLKRCNHSFEIKIGLMNLISRLITANQLMLHNFYSFMQKYTQPHQQNITHLLAILAQSIHPLVSPEVVEPLLIHISNTFVTDRRPNEVLAIGLNTIREICLRSPLVMNETLLKDLIQYKHSKDKGVMMASRSLIAVFRAINPQILPRKERGKDTNLEVKPDKFGEQEVLSGIEGTEYLDKVSYSAENSWETISSEDSNHEISSNDDNTTQDQSEASKTLTHSEQEIENEVDKGESDGDDDDGGKGELGDGAVSENMGENERSEKEREKEETGGDIQLEKGEKDGGDVSKNEEKLSLPRLEARKILSEEDWVKIRYIQEHKKKLQEKGVIPVLKKRKFEAVTKDVDAETISGWQKKRRLTKQERINATKESQEENALDKKHYTYGMRKQGASSTNYEKRKSKPYSMVRHKALAKQRRSAIQKIKMKEKHIRKLASQKLDPH